MVSTLCWTLRSVLVSRLPRSATQQSCCARAVFSQRPREGFSSEYRQLTSISDKGCTMRVLLTGHQGYIGAVAGPLLCSAGHEVIGLDTALFAGCEFGDAASAIPEIRKDIRDLTQADLEGFEAVVHLAALSNDPLGNLDADLTYDINHRASVHLAELAKEAGVKRFVFFSSCSTYGAAGDDFLEETAPVNPVTAYGESKGLVERDVAR